MLKTNLKLKERITTHKKLISIILFLLYIIGTGIYIGKYLFGYENSIILHTSTFFIFVILIWLAFHLLKIKNGIRHYLYVTEVCFLFFLICIYIYDADYFVRYQILVIPSIILAHVQLFFTKRIQITKS